VYVFRAVKGGGGRLFGVSVAYSADEVGKENG